MSTHAFVGSFQFGVTEEQVRSQSDRTAQVELDTVVTEPQPALDEKPVWESGTLPGVMAGKRPAPVYSV
jgi:hypothetical protein